MKLRDIISKLNSFAPFALAYDWDNSGLQIGSPESEIQKAMICLDVTDYAVQRAIDSDCQLIVSHHPLIFSGIKQITNPLYLKLIENKLAVVSLHTNLDLVKGGVNYCLAEALGLRVIDNLSTECGDKWYHLRVMVPDMDLTFVRDAAFAAGAGRIGSYDMCSSAQSACGTFRPLEGSIPSVGTYKSLEQVNETELSLMVESHLLRGVLSALKKAHPYETPSLYYNPVENTNPAYSLGLITECDEPMSLVELLGLVSERLHNPRTMLWTAGHPQELKVQRIAICGGSGSSLLGKAAGAAEVLITGDLSYHNLLDSPLPVVDAGHLHTEYPVLAKLQSLFLEWGLAAERLALHEHDFERKCLTNM